MKRAIGLICLIAICVCLFAAPASAADIEMMTNTVRALGIITGDEKGNLNLDKNVTRAEFAKMMVSASVYKDAAGKEAGASPFRDVPYSHWAAGSIQTAARAGWLSGYLDGSFRPDNSISLEEAATAALKMLGYTATDFVGAFPAAQLSLYQARGLDKNISRTQGQLMSRLDCLFLFYNLMTADTKAGSVYASALGYAINAAGELDYASLVAAELKGPYVLGKSGSLSGLLPFALSGAEIYRNGGKTSSEQLKAYDVIYYNSNLKTVWAYNRTVTGEYSAASPSTAAPSAVVVAGKSYGLETSPAAYELSELGSYKIGDKVTLLLGMHGQAAAVIPAGELNDIVYGVINSLSVQSFTDASGITRDRQFMTVALTDGSEAGYFYDSKDMKAGSLVAIDFSGGDIAITRPARGSGLSGRVGEAADSLGSRAFAPDAEFMDVNDEGGSLCFDKSRLAGVQIDSSDVRLAIFDGEGRISRLILDNKTGDLDSYALLTEVEEVKTHIPGSGYMLMGSYQYMLDGAKGIYVSSDTVYNIQSGAVRLSFKDGQLSDMESIEEISLSSINELYAMGEMRKLYLADNLSIYLKKNGEYLNMDIAAVSDTSKYQLTGYYDKAASEGGRLRIVLAREK